MVAIGHVRELGPIITAIIISGRTGAGFAAELGTMKVSEEVDALRNRVRPFLPRKRPVLDVAWCSLSDTLLITR